MLVSIVIPALNEEKNIVSCLKSIRAQKYAGRVELIVVDGRSKDKTVELAKKYADRVLVARKPIIAAGRQKGCMAAKGDILVFSDADVVADENWLARLVEPFEDEKTVCTFGAIYLRDGSALDSFLSKHVFTFFLRASNALGFSSGAGSNMAVRATAFKTLGGFRMVVTGEDVDLQSRLRRVGKIVFVPSAVISTSARRIKKWGFWKFVAFHAKNWVGMNLLHEQPMAEYEKL